ncbi:MAG: RnfH family protein [Janthinobacterium lividum]
MPDDSPALTLSPACLKVDVSYVGAPDATGPGRQFFRRIAVAPRSTLHEVIRQSGVLEIDHAIDLSGCKVGIHGKIRPLETTMRDGDRAEIYRPLVIDPMTARRRRATVKA